MVLHRNLLATTVVLALAFAPLAATSPALANTVTEAGTTLTMRDRVAVPSDDCRRPVAKLRAEVRPGTSITLVSTKVRRVASGKVKYTGPYVSLNDPDRNGVIRWRIPFKICSDEWPMGRYHLAVTVDPSGPKDSFRVANRFRVVPGDGPVTP